MSETIAMPKVSQSCRNRVVLVGGRGGDGVSAMTMVLLAMTPTGRPSMRASAVTISGAKRSRNVTEFASASVVMIGPIG